jgi:hypothetical protein
MDKLALIFLAFVFLIAGVNAYAGDIPPKEPYKGWIGPPPLKDSAGAKEKASAGYRVRNPSGCPQPEDVSTNPESAGVTTLLLCKQPVEPKKLPPKKETPKKSAPPAPAETAKALNPTKKAAPDPSEHADKAGNRGAR